MLANSDFSSLHRLVYLGEKTRSLQIQVIGNYSQGYMFLCVWRTYTWNKYNQSHFIAKQVKWIKTHFGNLKPSKCCLFFKNHSNGIGLFHLFSLVEPYSQNGPWVRPGSNTSPIRWIRDPHVGRRQPAVTRDWWLMAVDDKGPPLKLNIATEKCSYIPSRRYIVGTLNFRVNLI